MHVSKKSRSILEATEKIPQNVLRNFSAFGKRSICQMRRTIHIPTRLAIVCIALVIQDELLGMHRWFPGVFRDVRLLCLILSFILVCGTVYTGLYLLIFAGGYAYRYGSLFFLVFSHLPRWLYAVLGVLFIIFLVAGLIFETSMRTNLRKEFEDRIELMN